jgi:hypothetical protein
MFVVADREPACYEEKEDFDKAKRHHRRCEEMVDTVRRWSRVLRHEITEYEARVGQLVGWLEAEHPKAVGVLDRMLTSLEAYLTLQPYGGDVTSVTGETTEQPGSAARSGDAPAPPSVAVGERPGSKSATTPDGKPDGTSDATAEPRADAGPDVTDGARSEVGAEAAAAAAMAAASGAAADASATSPATAEADAIEHKSADGQA